jgi:putative ABC transport system ATP-binding protein
MVTHEPEVAIYTKRIVTMRDGTIVSDKRVDSPQRAAKDLAVARAKVAV